MAPPTSGYETPSRVRFIIVGRSRTCALSSGNPTVSRKHLMAKLENGQVVVRDLGSKNGTYLNGVEIHEAVVESGDELRLGLAVLLFEDLYRAFPK